MPDDPGDDFDDLSPEFVLRQRSMVAAQVVESGFSIKEAAEMYELTVAQVRVGQQELARIRTGQ
jgi:transposase